MKVLRPKKQILAVDIGGSKILTARITVSGTGMPAISARARRNLARSFKKDDIFRETVSAIEETLAAPEPFEPDGIGVTIPGLADPKTGEWLYAPFSGIRNFPIAEMLRDRYGKPVFAENDVNACAWAEHIFGVCKKIDDFLWITISNGIGGGLVLNGKIWRGHFGGAAEIGHLKVGEDGNVCGCGGRGCLEAEAAGPAIARQYYMRTGTRLPADKIAEMARCGYEPAIIVYRRTGRYLGKGAAAAANLINPAAIVVGGGVAQSFDLFAPEMEQVFRNEAFAFTNKKVRILKTGLGYEAGLFAAASLLYPEKQQLT